MVNQISYEEICPKEHRDKGSLLNPTKHVWPVYLEPQKE